MRNLLLFMLLTFIFGCSSKKSIIEPQRENWGYKHWNQDFKDRALCNCLVKGYQKKEIVNKIYQIDKSYYNPVAIVLFDSLINKILEKEVLKMKNDSLTSIQQVSEAKAGKNVFSHCLKFYKSRELDEIAKSQSKKWKKIKNIDSLVAGNIPTY